MKKLFSLIAALALVFTLAACEKIVEVPVEVIKEVIVTETETVIETVTETIYETIYETVTETVYVDVPANVENERFYTPGVYFNNTAVDANGVYTYTVVVVDAYGRIAGIMFDDTKTSSEFLTDGDNLYVYIAGDGKTVPNTYRLIDELTAPGAYPTAADAITADDLVVGIHQAAIAELEEMPAYESSRILGEAWVGKTEALVERVIADQSTYGITTSSAGEGVVATNVDTDLDNVDVLLGLVQEVLDGEAALTEDVVLATDAVKGLYAPGYKWASTERIISKGSVSYYTSFVVVDANGRIAGVFNDATTNDKLTAGAVSTKQILGSDYGIDWFAHADAFSAAVVKNQGVEAISDNADYAETDTDKTGHQYTDIVAGATVGVEGMIEATNGALGQLPMKAFNDGTYLVAGEGDAKHAFMYVTVADGALESIYLDNTQGAEQATVLREGEWRNVFTFDLYVDEENTESILVFFDGTDYIALEEFTNFEDDLYEVNDEVEFLLDEENGIDEEATLEIVPAYMTKQILNDRYGMNPDNNWYAQADVLAAAFVANGVYGINFTDAEHTDITGVTFGHIGEYQQMIVEALLLATETGNAFNSTTEFAAADLVDGTYFASLEADEAGEQLFGWMNVVDGAVETLVFDRTTEVAGKVTTINNIFNPKAESDDDDYDNYTDTMAYVAAADADYTSVIDDVVAAYSYADSAFDYDVVTSGDQAYVAADGFDALVAQLAEQAVEANVAKEAAAVFTAIDAYADDAILTGENQDSSQDLMDIVANAAGNATFDVTFTSSDEDVVSLSSREDAVSYEAEVNGSADLTVTLELNGYVSAAHSFTLTFITEATLAKETMEDSELKLAWGTIVEGFNFTLPTVTYTELDNDVVTATWMVKGDSGLVDITTYTGKAIADDKVSETVTFIAWFDTDTEGTANVVDTKEISREFTVVVMDEIDAVKQVKDSATPGNILEEVTASTITGFSYDDSIGGVTLAWSNADADWATLNVGSGILDIVRQQDATEEGTLTATITSVSDSDSKEFHFYVPQADTAVMTARMNAALAAYVLDHAQYDLATSDGVLAAVNAALYTNDSATFKWEVVDGEASFAVETVPTITFTELGEVTVKVTVTAASADGADSVKVSKEFTVNVVNEGLIG